MNEAFLTQEFSVHLPSNPPHSVQYISERESSLFMEKRPQCGHGGKPWPLFGSRNRRRIRRSIGIRGQPRFGLRTFGIQPSVSRAIFTVYDESIVTSAPVRLYAESLGLDRDHFSINRLGCSNFTLNSQQCCQWDTEVLLIFHE